MTSIPVLARLGYKLLKCHRIKDGSYLVLAQMELPETTLVAITTNDEILDAQVFIDNPKGAQNQFKLIKQRLFTSRTTN